MPTDLNSGSVLGITDFGPVGGTPLIPPSYLTVYFAIFLVILISFYIYFYLKRRPVHWHGQLKLLASLAIAINVVAFGGGSLVLAYWLVPKPGIRRTIPVEAEQKFSPTNRIEIVFDRPIDRNLLEKSISPDIPGRWVFENSLYTTHLYRKLVFYPTYSLRSDTEYTVKLNGIRNLVKLSKPYEYEFRFKTQRSPGIPVAAPFNEGGDVDVDSEINVVLDSPNNNLSEFSFNFDPVVDFDANLDSEKRVYTLKPKTSLKQGTNYHIRIQKSDLIINLEDGSIFERGQETEVYNRDFKTVEAPGIKSFKPLDESVSKNSEIIVEFSKEMDKASVEDNFLIEPKTLGAKSWEGNNIFKFKPLSLAFNTEYKVTFKKDTKAIDGSFFETDLIKTFKTIGPAKVTNSIPEDGWKGVNLKSAVKVTFDQEVDHDSAQSKFSITPEIKGSFSWDGNTMSFSPESTFLATTSYDVIIAKGIKSINGQDSTEEYKLQFSTQEGTTKLAVPAYLQKYTLSCEIASLRMALNFKGQNLSEDDIIPKVGQDKTPHNGGIWGNPNTAFVGNIAGTQMKDGYGVHWGPIAKAARNYRDAEAFEGWGISRLTEEISKGNPIVIWVYSHYGTPTYWNTPDGTRIYAVRDEHAVTAVGFVGSPENPSQIIINDPLHGQVYWSRSSFDRKFAIFNNSGVVVR